MTTFDERERSFEEKFKLDQEIRFKVHARRNKLLGRWAAEKMKLAPAEADAYATALVDADIAKFHDDEIARKIHKDLTARGIAVSEAEVRREMDRLLVAAKKDISGRA